MVTVSPLGSLLFGETRRAILALLYGHSDEQFYLRELVRRTETALGAAQRELSLLTAGGLVQRVRRGNQGLLPGECIQSDLRRAQEHIDENHGRPR
jgi:DNA-binding transcriptional ArsR family regulator